MFIGHFTERPYQDPSSGYFGATGRSIMDLGMSNGTYDPKLGADLYNRYLDERVFAEEMGFDGLMLNEHHSTPFCMGGVMNLEAAILARITRRAKIVLLGNILPIWDDPLFLAEELAEIDMISRGRLVTGWVRGTGRESVAHNAVPPFNWERFQEAHDFIVEAWTKPGPFRWEGEHYQYRYVNPWARPYQDPHPPIWIPGVMSRNTVKWAAQHRYPYVMLATELQPTVESFQYYDEVAAEAGYEAGTQHRAYLFKVHVDETEELAEAAGRKYVQGPSNPFLEGNQGIIRPFIQNLPGLTQRNNLPPTMKSFGAAASRGRASQHLKDKKEAAPPEPPRDVYVDQTEKLSIISGTPDTVIPKVRHVLETIRPGTIFFWDGDGAMSHDDQMRSLRLMGSDVIPAVREIGEKLDLKGPFEVDPRSDAKGDSDELEESADTTTSVS